MKTKNVKNGIQLRFDRSRHLRLLSYAVIINGGATVSHATTAAARKEGANLVNMVRIEQSRNPALQIF